MPSEDNSRKGMHNIYFNRLFLTLHSNNSNFNVFFMYLGLSVIRSDESLMLTLKAIGFDPKITGINVDNFFNIDFL